MWLIPGHAQLDVAGVHWGVDTIAYVGITGLNGGGNFKGLKWHRHPTRAEAEAAFRAEAHIYGLPESFAERLVGWLAKE